MTGGKKGKPKTIKKSQYADGHSVNRGQRSDTSAFRARELR